MPDEDPDLEPRPEATEAQKEFADAFVARLASDERLRRPAWSVSGMGAFADGFDILVGGEFDSLDGLPSQYWAKRISLSYDSARESNSDAVGQIKSFSRDMCSYLSSRYGGRWRPRGRWPDF